MAEVFPVAWSPCFPDFTSRDFSLGAQKGCCLHFLISVSSAGTCWEDMGCCSYTPTFLSDVCAELEYRCCICSATRSARIEHMKTVICMSQKFHHVTYKICSTFNSVPLMSSSFVQSFIDISPQFFLLLNIMVHIKDGALICL